ncbi:hypothetical protein AcV7_004604 [Taiwanofungus camphoratus]|nr:hypothetical protein AcV7_004604 [Antrodia cinnamomea]
MYKFPITTTSQCLEWVHICGIDELSAYCDCSIPWLRLCFLESVYSHHTAISLIFSFVHKTTNPSKPSGCSCGCPFTLLHPRDYVHQTLGQILEHQ